MYSRVSDADVQIRLKANLILDNLDWLNSPICSRLHEQLWNLKNENVSKRKGRYQNWYWNSIIDHYV